MMSALAAAAAKPAYDPFDPSQEEVQARIRLLEWINSQLASGAVVASVGDYVLATEGRILGVGPDLEELSRQIIAAEPDLINARIVADRIHLHEY